MNGKREIKSLKLKNFLSYGEEQTIELQPLNVLIGPNASGKSNFLEALRLLGSLPVDLEQFIRTGGGMSEYIWKGNQENFSTSIELKRDRGFGEEAPALRYAVTLVGLSQRVEVEAEIIEYDFLNEAQHKEYDGRPFVFRRHREQGTLQYYLDPFQYPRTDQDQVTEREVTLSLSRSVLSQIKDPNLYPDLMSLEYLLSEIQFSGDWDVSRYGELRRPQRLDLPTDMLLPNASNLGLLLINQPHHSKQLITEKLQEIYPEIEEIVLKVESNSVQIFFREQHLKGYIPAIRTAAGLLRYLCLTVLLNQRILPSVICLDEPEVGLHPHAIPKLTEQLVEATQRTQLIVATQSDALISGLTDVPEAIIICERDLYGTHLRRLTSAEVKPWLPEYALGDLWRMGEIGGAGW